MSHPIIFVGRNNSKSIPTRYLYHVENTVPKGRAKTNHYDVDSDDDDDEEENNDDDDDGG